MLILAVSPGLDFVLKYCFGSTLAAFKCSFEGFGQVELKAYPVFLGTACQPIGLR